MIRISSQPTFRPEWGEEQLRYRILRAIYDRTDGNCEHAVTGSEVGAMLDLRFEDLFRVIHFLEYHGYLDYLGAGPRVCITDKGVRYIEEIADRRRSIRDAERRFTIESAAGGRRRRGHGNEQHSNAEPAPASTGTFEPEQRAPTPKQ